MDVVDPREEYDDLVEAREEVRLDPAEFREFRDSEAVAAGWAAGGAVFDDRGRLLLVRNPEGVWLLPGGVLEPSESLATAARREVREETGIEIEPRRPVAIRESVASQGGESRSFRFVVLSATATDTTIADDPGLVDEPIAGAAWVEGLPDRLYQRNFYERLLAEIPDWDG